MKWRFNLFIFQTLGTIISKKSQHEIKPTYFLYTCFLTNRWSKLYWLTLFNITFTRVQTPHGYPLWHRSVVTPTSFISGLLSLQMGAELYIRASVFENSQIDAIIITLEAEAVKLRHDANMGIDHETIVGDQTVISVSDSVKVTCHHGAHWEKDRKRF